ncbi:MAG: hypothetical protein J6B89_03360 [Bacilli bacterium]|nr:hypothetical protein [Bacilli bacterium]
MIKGQKSVRAGIEDFLCPFTDMHITQGSGGAYSHKGIMANDVRGKQAGIRYPYYAPCKIKCLKVFKDSGQSMWQSVNKVRFANGRVDYATMMIAHDDSQDCYVSQIVEQGSQLGNMGTKGNATGVHCHIQISQSKDSSWFKNQYGIYKFNNEYDTDDCYFVDNTNILQGLGGNWRKTSDVPVQETNKKEYVNLPSTIKEWRFYDLNVSPVKKNTKGYIKPKKFGGLSYLIHEYRDDGTTVVIETQQFGKVKIYIKDTVASITKGSHKYNSGNY